MLNESRRGNRKKVLLAECNKAFIAITSPAFFFHNALVASIIASGAVAQSDRATVS